MITYGAVLRLMFTNSYISVSHTLTIIGLTVESAPKLINKSRNNIFENPILKMKDVT